MKNNTWFSKVHAVDCCGIRIDYGVQTFKNCSIRCENVLHKNAKFQKALSSKLIGCFDMWIPIKRVEFVSICKQRVYDFELLILDGKR